MKHHLCCVLGILAAGSPVLGQSFNIEFGPSGSAVPPSTYAAVGWPGVWNTFASLPTNVTFPLVGLNGQATGAYIYNNGGTQFITGSSGATGADAALMGDMFLSFNNPTDLCLWVGNLQAGMYQVIMYAMTPGNSSLLSRVRVDNASPGPTMVGGAWPGHHVQGVTYQTFTITVPANGTIAFHSGLAGGNIQSGLNGVQFVRQPDCYVNCDLSTSPPVLNINDFACFINYFAAGHPYANCDGSTTAPTLNVLDFACFVNRYAAGCP